LLDALWERRALLVSGKGGVGKTTLAAALARAAVASGRRVLLAEVEVSSDEQEGPSPLASLVGAREPGPRVTEVSPGLSFVRLSPIEGQRLFLQDVLPLKMMAEAAMRMRALRRFLEAAPALREMGVLYQMLALVRRTHSDGRFVNPLCVVDLPATGHALALASLPRSILSVMPGGPIGRAVREGLDLIQDPQRTGVFLVTLPEPLPVSETLEMAGELGRLGLPLSATVLNRMPEDPFETDHREAVGRLLDTHGPHQGARALARLDRAMHARARLAGNLAVPLLTLPEVRATGSALVERLATSLTPTVPPPQARAGATS
jgi:arsenite-transporting ATPase